MPPTPTAAPAGQLTPPFFDTHVHYSEDAWGVISVEQALALMDQAGTRLALVSSTPDAGTIRLHAAAPTRIIPVLRPYRTRGDISTWHQDRTLLDYLHERLALGVHRGIGEFHLNGDDATAPVVAEVVRLATARQLLLHAHSDERAVHHLFSIDPAARVLWAHAGFAGPATVRAMVERYPTLWVEFAFRSDVATSGQLDADWRALVEQYPDRFMIGTDSYVVSRWASMPAILGAVRAWCGTLPPVLRDNLAWRNAARLLGVDETIFGTAAMVD